MAFGILSISYHLYRMTFVNKDLQLLDTALTMLKTGFDSFPDTLNTENENRIRDTLLEVSEKLHNNYPYFQSNYAGQMLKPPHAIARLAYMLALYVNPNNHALDGSRASSPMERECIDDIAAMYGWQNALGHLTGGGTMANLEGLWIASKCHPGKVILGSELAHYTHERISHVLGINFQKVAANNRGEMDVLALESELKKGKVGTVVVTMGTTGIGSVDPLPDILSLQEKYHFRIHVDAAYGGYFVLSDALSDKNQEKFNSISRADSIVIDPHKHGLQPYGCGCIVFKDPQVGKYYKHDSPYTYFTSDDLHLGEISLECSRAGAAAVALWATMKCFPLIKAGEFSRQLNGCHRAAHTLYNYVEQDDRFISLVEPSLDIVVWGVSADSLSEMSYKAKTIFQDLARKNVHLALIKYPTKLLPKNWDHVSKDADYVTCLRSCLMKPAHESYISELWYKISDSFDAMTR